MAVNLLLTGPPRSGKTTVIRRVRERLQARNYSAGGVFCPEIRDGGDRVGFEIVDISTGDSRVLAHTDFDTGPKVGKYRVSVADIDAVSAAAFERARAEADVVLVDEVAPMQRHSTEFVDQVRRTLDSGIPALAAIHYRSTAGFIGEVKRREDCERFEVTDATRDGLPETLADRLLDVL